jgi:hypothetical protein
MRPERNVESRVSNAKVGKCIEIYLHCFHKKKGKAFPLQAWTGPEVSRSLRLPDFKTIGT